MTASDLVVGDIYVCKVSPEYKRRITYIDAKSVLFSFTNKLGNCQEFGSNWVDKSDFLRWASLAEKQEPAANPAPVVSIKTFDWSTATPQEKVRRRWPNAWKWGSPDVWNNHTSGVLGIWSGDPYGSLGGRLGRNWQEAAQHPSVLELERQETAASSSVASAVEASVGEVKGFDAWWESKVDGFDGVDAGGYSVAKAAWSTALCSLFNVQAIQRDSEVEGMRKALEVVRGIEKAQPRSLEEYFPSELRSSVVWREDAESAILAKIEEAS